MKKRSNYDGGREGLERKREREGERVRGREEEQGGEREEQREI